MSGSTTYVIHITTDNYDELFGLLTKCDSVEDFELVAHFENEEQEEHPDKLSD